MRLPSAGLLAAGAMFLGNCGYHVSGHADLLPKNIRTIAVVPFDNATMRARLPQSLAAALTREFITRTRYRIVSDPNEADAVLKGSIHQLVAFPTVFDPVTGRSTAIQIAVALQVRLENRATGAVLFQRPNMELRERYEISIDQFAYFEESGTALERWGRDVARTVVSAILEQF
jgi:hypothetical protein